MRDNIRAERYTFRERKEFDQSYNGAKFLRQECISKADWPYSVHGSHRLLRSCKIRDDRHDFSYLDSNVEHGKYRVERELVSTESSTGREISLFFRNEGKRIETKIRISDQRGSTRVHLGFDRDNGRIGQRNVRNERIIVGSGYTKHIR